jgi:hypothetical protein
MGLSIEHRGELIIVTAPGTEFSATKHSRREQVDRLFRLHQNSRIDQIEAAFEAIGVPLVFNIPLPDAA